MNVSLLRIWGLGLAVSLMTQGTAFAGTLGGVEAAESQLYQNMSNEQAKSGKPLSPAQQKAMAQDAMTGPRAQAGQTSGEAWKAQMKDTDKKALEQQKRQKEKLRDRLDAAEKKSEQEHKNAAKGAKVPAHPAKAASKPKTSSASKRRMSNASKAAKKSGGGKSTGNTAIDPGDLSPTIDFGGGPEDPKGDAEDSKGSGK
ncbi:MAG TPA: hypothetical protein VL588_10015 [Bdellovibrionota bacterium]|jgi:septal ring factor EnvC (AmiA/AmiB activator)|nr:hypothetical protein [Bdellovibrionota bacterium]